MSMQPRGMVLDLPATLILNTWAGRRTYRIRITGETREKYKFEALEDIPMPRNRWLKAGQAGRAPKTAVATNGGPQ
jgi:hypothetical protein